MARRVQSAKRSPGKTPFAPSSPHIQRVLSHFDPLNSAGIERSEAQVEWILENVGVAFRDDLAALQVWRDAGITPGGHFLGSADTMRNYGTAFYEPALSNSENVETWEEAGGKDMRVRAHECWNAILQSYLSPPMDDSTRVALQDYVARRKSELPDAWY